MNHHLLPISEDELAAILQTPPEVRTLVERRWGDVQSLGRDGDAIVALTAERADDPLAFISILRPPDAVSGLVGRDEQRNGAVVVPCEVDMGYGPASYFKNSLLREVAHKLAPITAEVFSGNYDPEGLETNQIYPLGWHAPGRKEKLIESYNRYRACVMAAAAAGQHLLMWFADPPAVFDIEKLEAFCVTEIAKFAAQHKGETFYAFAIDSSLLCLNSLEGAQRTLKKYQDLWEQRTRPLASMAEMTKEDHLWDDFGLGLENRHGGLDLSDEQACLHYLNNRRQSQRDEGCPYRTEEGIRGLRDNTGDWAYQGFAIMGEDAGFDEGAYEDHYCIARDDSEAAAKTPYAKAMDELIRRLKERDAFRELHKTPDFYARRVEHTY